MKNTLSRSILPFYMKLPVFWAFIILTFIGEVLWIAVVTHDHRADLLTWSCFGYALGIVVGFMQGKWTSRLWENSYLQVLRRKITFWEAKGAKSLTFFTCIALGLPIIVAILIDSTDQLVGIQSYMVDY